MFHWIKIFVYHDCVKWWRWRFKSECFPELSSSLYTNTKGPYTSVSLYTRMCSGLELSRAGVHEQCHSRGAARDGVQSPQVRCLGDLVMVDYIIDSLCVRVHVCVGVCMRDVWEVLGWTCGGLRVYMGRHAWGWWWDIWGTGETWRCGEETWGMGVVCWPQIGEQLIQDTLKSSTLSCILLVSCIVCRRWQRW